MRVLVNAISAKVGGAAHYIQQLVSSLNTMKCQHQFVFLLAQETANKTQVLGTNIEVLTSDPLENVARRMWFDQVVLRRILRRKRIDILFSTANFGMIACPCRQVLLVRNSLYFSEIYRTIIQPHRSPGFHFEHRLRRYLVWASVKAADLVIAPSASMLEELQRCIRIPPQRVAVHHYGVDLRLFGQLERTPAPPNEVRLLFTSLYAEHKNFGTLLRATLKLNEGHQRFTLTTPADPKWERVNNSIRTREAGLSEPLRQRGLLRLTGILEPESLAKLYGEADVFVYPSVVESFGHPLLEAMAAGLPIVASDVPINRELCEDAALYFSPFDEEDCARKIRILSENSSLKIEMGRRASARAQHFSWEHHTHDLLESLVGS